MEKKTPITFFDILTVNQSIQMLKALIPFLDFDLQKNLAIIIRINELLQTIDFYKSTKNFCQIRSCIKSPILTPFSSLDNILCNDEIINTIIPYCPDEYISLLKNYKQFSKMSDIMNIFSKMDSSSDTMNPSAPFSDIDNISDIIKVLGSSITPDMLNNINNVLSQMNVQKDVQKDVNSSNDDNNSQNNTNMPPVTDTPVSSYLKNMMSPKQQEIYNDFLNRLDEIDFNNTNNE